MTNLFLACLMALWQALFFSPQRIPGLGGTAPSSGGGLSAIDGTSVKGITGTLTATHNLNLQSGDLVWIYVFYPPSGNCTTPTLVWSDTATNTFTLVPGSSKVLNGAFGTLCNAQFEIKTATANSADTIQVAGSSFTSFVAGFQAIQIRGSANLDADTTANVSGVAGAASTTVIPSMTSTTAVSIVVAGMNYSGSSVTATPTASGCFGVTGTAPSNTGSSSTTWAALQYAILSTTQSGACSFNNSLSVVGMGQGAIYH